MKWFDQWFARKSHWAWEHRNTGMSINKLEGGLTIDRADPTPDWGDGLRMNVKKIIGGYVVSFHVWDRIKDRSDDRHYIITDEQDFNAELGKMITMESMRQT